MEEVLEAQAEPEAPEVPADGRPEDYHRPCPQVCLSFLLSVATFSKASPEAPADVEVAADPMEETEMVVLDRLVVVHLPCQHP